MSKSADKSQHGNSVTCFLLFPHRQLHIMSYAFDLSHRRGEDKQKSLQSTIGLKRNYSSLNVIDSTYPAKETSSSVFR